MILATPSGILSGLPWHARLKRVNPSTLEGFSSRARWPHMPVPGEVATPAALWRTITGMRLRIATWNMNSWQRAKVAASAWALLSSLEVDIALDNEAIPPPRTHGPSLPRCVPDAADGTAWHIGPSRKWGTAVAVYNPAFSVTPIPLYPLARRPRGELAVSHPGTIAVAEIGVPDAAPIVAVSTYGLMDDWTPAVGSYATTTVNRMLSDLTPLFDSKRGQRLVLGGDLNVGDQGGPGTSLYRWLPMHRATMDRFAAMGLTDLLRAKVPDGRGPLAGCPCGGGRSCRHVRTQRYRNLVTSPPWQNDYIFAGSWLAARCSACFAFDDETAWALSDHCPVIVEFDV